MFSMKRYLILAFCVIYLTVNLEAQAGVWQPSLGYKQIPIWPEVIPDSIPVPEPENYTATTQLIAGQPVIMVNNVSEPTMTVYSPRSPNTGVAVIVFPGGGYNCLAIDLEGTEICDWLISNGITAILLKYRVPTPKVGRYWESTKALEDAQRTVGLVRFNADKWHINPYKIGVLGFSAGGHLVTAISTRYHKRLYTVMDAADNESCRPDFALALYPGHLWHHDTDFALNPNIAVTGNTPPTFIVQAEDDPVDNVNNSLVYYIALKDAGIPVEMHLYAEGGHAFGLRHTEHQITKWPELAQTWLQTIGMINQNPEVNKLIKSLDDQDWHERSQAIEMLCGMGLNARAAIPSLIERLDDEEWQVRYAAATALTRMKPVPEQAISSLISALSDEEWQVRKSVAEAIAAIGTTSETAVSALTKALSDIEWQVRKPVAEALATSGPISNPAIDALIKALSDEEWQVRNASAMTLSTIGAPAINSIQALTICLNDPEEQVRNTAANAIEKINK